jgi:DNA-binding CsgD family transcriptional regulator
MNETRSARSRRRAPGDLTARQRQVLDLVSRGYTNAQIADALGVSLAGAKWHVGEIIGVLGVDTREEAADIWRVENGLRARLRRSLASLIPSLGSVGGRPILALFAGAPLVVAAAIVTVWLLGRSAPGGNEENAAK